jgi:predicted lysophospholipase L1 biosynthesis ABC-type transport system permease subunit
MYTEFGRVVELGLVASLVLAGCSLAVAVTTAMLDRRRQFAFLRSAGMSVGRLRTVVLLQAGVPLVAVALASAVLGIAVAQLVLRLADAPAIVWPDPSLTLVLAVSLLAAMGVVALTLPGLERLTRPESVRAE